MKKLIHLLVCILVFSTAGCLYHADQEAPTQINMILQTKLGENIDEYVNIIASSLSMQIESGQSSEVDDKRRKKWVLQGDGIIITILPALEDSCLISKIRNRQYSTFYIFNVIQVGNSKRISVRQAVKKVNNIAKQYSFSIVTSKGCDYR